jgi:hypothetical protein
VSLGWRNVQALAGVVERPRAYPPDARLNGVQNGQQPMPIGRVAAESGAAIRSCVSQSTVPAGFRLPQLGVDGGFLVGAGLG